MKGWLTYHQHNILPPVVAHPLSVQPCCCGGSCGLSHWSPPSSSSCSPVRPSTGDISCLCRYPSPLSNPRPPAGRQVRTDRCRGFDFCINVYYSKSHTHCRASHALVLLVHLQLDELRAPTKWLSRLHQTPNGEEQSYGSCLWLISFVHASLSIGEAVLSRVHWPSIISVLLTGSTISSDTHSLLRHCCSVSY